MFPTRYILQFKGVLILSLFVLVVGMGPRDAAAQFNQKPMAIGDLTMIYTETGGEQEFWKSEGNGMEWEGITQRGFHRANALWIGLKNFTDEDGNTFERKVVHIGPRVTGFGEFFPREFEVVSRFETPTVTVDERETLDDDLSEDRVDPDLPAERMIRLRANTQTGIELEKRIYAWSQEFHDDYHIQEYILTNTGNTDRDEDIELPDQTAEDVYLHMQRRYTHGDDAVIPGSGWGANVMNDVVGDGMEDYEHDFHASFTWMGNSPGADIDPLGAPAWTSGAGFIPDGDNNGLLTQAAHIGITTIHADTSPTDESHDPEQPSMTGFIDSDDNITQGNDATNEEQMIEEYQFMSEAGVTGLPVPEGGSEGPHEYPHHADVVDPDGDFTTPDGDPMLGRPGGWSQALSYGPYTLEPGESVRIVVAEGVGGLGKTAESVIGRKFKENANGNRAQADPFAPIEYDADRNGTIEPDERMGKNEWAINAAKDSLFLTFERAHAAYEAAFEEGRGLPSPPRPPKTFDVVASAEQISLTWTPPEDESDVEKYAVFRARERVEGDFRLDPPYTYERIATVDATGQSEYSFIDETATRGIEFFYYIQSVGSENTDGTAMTPTGKPLRSSRYYTQTYDPAQLKRDPGEEVSEFKVVPNPLNIGSDPEVRWPGRDNRIAFLEIPGNAEIRIYTELGELVQTIQHDDGSGDEFWDLNTQEGQLVASGIYIAVVENLENGSISRKKFVIIR